MNDDLLIYTVSVGERYRQRASLLVCSLRLAGFTGPVYVMSDAPIDCPANVIVIPAEELVARNMTEWRGSYLKAIPIDFIPGLFAHAHIAYLDADVLCLGDWRVLKVDRITCQREDGSILRFCGDLPADVLGKVDASRSASCSGVVAFPGTTEGADFLRQWRQECDRRIMLDQQALNRVTARNGESFYFSASAVSFAAEGRPTDFRHYRAMKAYDVMECDLLKAYGPRGLGDVVAKVTTALGIPPCDGCKDRQAALNKAVPFK